MNRMVMDMKQDCWTFLEMFLSDELENRGILHPRGSRYELKADSVDPLMELMKERSVARLVARERRWFLTSDGEFANPGAPPGMKRGRVANLRNPGDVFKTQNRYINPHYNRSQSPAISPKPPVSSSTLTPRPLTADELGRMRRKLLRIMDCIEDSQSEEGPTGRVLRLRNEEWIPRLVAQAMLMFIEARNILEFNKGPLSSKQEAAVRAAWEVVREWAADEGLAAALNV